MGVGVIRQFAVGVYLWVQVVKDAYAVSALDEFIDEVRADESHAAGDENVFGCHLFQDFSDVEFFVGLWSPGQHVGEQARADELYAEYGEEDPEHEQGIPVLDGAGLEPEGCDVCVDEHARDAKDEAHCAKEVEWPAHVFADVHDGEEVKKSFEQASPAVFGYAVLTRVVLDGYFADAVSFYVGEYGDVAVEFAEYAYVFCDFAAIDFEAAVKVVYVNARYKARDPVEEFGGQGFAQGIKAFFLPSGDEVIAFFDFG